MNQRRDQRMNKNSQLISRFIEYVEIDTRSSETSEKHPSTEIQFRLAEKLTDELEKMGYNAALDRDKCYVYATIPSNIEKDDVPTVGFIAHMDTSPEVSDTGVKPRMIEYNGGDIELNHELNIIMKAVDYPSLEDYIGQHLIVTDGICGLYLLFILVIRSSSSTDRKTTKNILQLSVPII
jgi:tripeptide aminopeptidase